MRVVPLTRLRVSVFLTMTPCSHEDTDPKTGQWHLTSQKTGPKLSLGPAVVRGIDGYGWLRIFSSSEREFCWPRKKSVRLTLSKGLDRLRLALSRA